MATIKTTYNNIILTTSDGNKKLVPSNKVKYIIWNLPAVKTCPYATEMCKKACYALKAERCYPTARASRERNLDASRNADFIPGMINHIRGIMARRTYKNAVRVVVRIHESGDFYNQEYFNAWLAIANACADLENLVFVAYTKSLPYVHDVPENFTVRASVWDDTTAEALDMIKALNLPIYTAVPAFTDETPRERCNCINCSTCFKCFTSKFELLKCEIH